MTIQPLAVEFWIRPASSGPARQLLLDLGDGAVPSEDVENARNQLRLYLEGGYLTLRIDDPIYDESAPAAYGGYVLASSSVALSPHHWHHVAVAVVGTFPDEIAMFVDGRSAYDGEANWEYHYVDDLGAATWTDSPTHGYFWPIARDVENQSSTLAAPAIFGSNTLVLAADIGLPAGGGMIVVDHTVDGLCEYRYSSYAAATSTITLAAPLPRSHSVGDGVAPMIPLAQADAHGTKLLPSTGEKLGLWGFSPTASGTSYDSKPAADMVEFEDAATIEKVVDDTTDSNFPGYCWLGFDPSDFPLKDAGGGPVNLTTSYKAFSYSAFTSNAAAALSGALPSGPMTESFRVGGSRADGQNVFQGELDEVRITALPVALVQAGGWNTTDPAPQPPVQAEHWGWTAAGAALQDGAALPLPLASSALPMTGGYFMADGDIYCYQAYDPVVASPTYGQIGGISQVDKYLVPTDTPYLAQNLDGLRRIIPLNFIECSTLANNYNIGDGDIPLVDATAFPSGGGYVQIGREIIAYQSKSGNTLVRPVNGDGVSAFPRGAYDTTAGNHDIGDVVRLVPVRRPDRYRAGANWSDHVKYTDGQLNNEMCMFRYTFSHPGRLSRVQWRLKEPVGGGQIAVLVLVDDGADPDGDGKVWSEIPYPDGTDEPLLWGKLSSAATATEGKDGMDIFNSAGEHPQVSSHVEIRVYFDLSGTNAFDSGDCIELDAIGIEMVPQPQTF